LSANPGCANTANSITHLRVRGWRLGAWANHCISALWICAKNMTTAKLSHDADFWVKPLAHGSGHLPGLNPSSSQEAIAKGDGHSGLPAFGNFKCARPAGDAPECPLNEFVGDPPRD
jgi:hypothetical protein